MITITIPHWGPALGVLAAAALALVAAGERLPRRFRTPVRTASTEKTRIAEEVIANLHRLAEYRYKVRRREAFADLAAAAATGLRAGVALALDEIEFGGSR